MRNYTEIALVYIAMYLISDVRNKGSPELEKKCTGIVKDKSLNGFLGLIAECLSPLPEPQQRWEGLCLTPREWEAVCTVANQAPSLPATMCTLECEMTFALGRTNLFPWVRHLFPVKIMQHKHRP